MNVKLLTEHHLEFLSLKEGCRGFSESTHVRISNCWKVHAAAHFECACVANQWTLITSILSHVGSRITEQDG